jgi:2-C-methyl-D-erythritol 2,4-cyclodiphosphate synthase
LGDIGKHFPPGAPKYQGISSLNLLAEVRKKLFDNDWTIQNIDATVITEKPRLRDVIDTMREHLSRTLGIHINQMSVKASTANGVGSIGRGEGIAALAIASLTKNTKR